VIPSAVSRHSAPRAQGGPSLCRCRSSDSPAILLLCVNYHASRQTRAFLREALALPGADTVHAHVVDNSGEAEHLLRDLETSLPSVCYFRAPENLGYLGAAQVGFDAYASRHGPPDLTVVANTDIAFPNRSFWERLLDMRPVGQITAPSIVSAPLRNDQNPYLSRRPGPLTLLLLRAFWATYPTYVAYLALQIGLRAIKAVRRRSAPARNIYAPHGSFFILGRAFFERGGTVDVGTFLFGEELLLAEQARRLAVPVRYEPALRVLHMEHATTGFLKNRRHYEASREAVRRYLALRRQEADAG